MQLQRFWVGWWVSVCLFSVAGRPAEEWRKLEAGDFVVLSNAPEKDITEFAVGYSGFRHVIRLYFLRAGQTLPSSRVLLFKEPEEFQRRARVPAIKEAHTLCQSAELDGHPFMAFATGGNRKEALRVAFESEAQWSLERLGYGPPLWMAQGVGEVLSSIETGDGACTVGIRPAPFRAFISADLKWPVFFEVDTTSPAYAGPYSRGYFHSQAWALMHWILLSDENPQARLEALSSNVRSLGSQGGIAKTMGIAEKDLTDAIVAHFRKVRTRAVPFDDAAARAAYRISSVSEAEARAWSAQLALGSGRTDQAAEDLAVAQRLEPRAPFVLEAQARREEIAGARTAAVDLYRQAIAAGSKSPLAYLVSAEARLLGARTSSIVAEGAAAENFSAALGELRQAIALDPDNVRAYVMLGTAFFTSPKVRPEWVDELSAGIRDDARTVPIRELRAALCERLGRTDEALADSAYIMNRNDVPVATHNSSEERWLKGNIARDLKQVNGMIERGDFEGARKQIAAGRASPVGKRAPGAYQRMEQFVAEQELWAALQQAYREKRWSEVAAMSERFLHAFPKAKRSAAVSQLREEARSHLTSGAGG